MEFSSHTLPPQSFDSFEEKMCISSIYCDASRSSELSQGHVVGREYDTNRESSTSDGRMGRNSDKENIERYNVGQLNPPVRGIKVRCKVEVDDVTCNLQSDLVNSVKAEPGRDDSELPFSLSREAETRGTFHQKDSRNKIYTSSRKQNVKKAKQDKSGESNMDIIDSRQEEKTDSLLYFKFPKPKKKIKTSSYEDKDKTNRISSETDSAEEGPEFENVSWESTEQSVSWERTEQSVSWENTEQSVSWENTEQSVSWESTEQNASWENTEQNESWESQEQTQTHYGLRKRKASVLSRFKEMEVRFSDSETESDEESKPFKSSFVFLKESTDEDYVPDSDLVQEEEGEELAPIKEEGESEAREEFTEISPHDKYSEWVRRDGNGPSEDANKSSSIIEPPPPPSIVIKNSTECQNSKMKSLSSLPEELCLGMSTFNKGMGVFSMVPLGKGSKLGPMEGESRTFEEMDMKQDLTHIWMVPIDKKKEENPEDKNYICMNSEMTSNWCRYLQISTIRDQCNLKCFADDKQIFFKTTKLLQPGEELICYLDRNTTVEKACEYATLTCCWCKIKFDSDVLLSKHKHIFHTYGLMFLKSQCTLCKKIFPTSRKLSAHCQKEHSGKGAYQCPDCGKEFTKRIAMETHRKRVHHAGKREFKCKICDKVFNLPQDIRQHTRRHHCEATFKCEICERMFKSKIALTRHYNVHNPNRKYTCQFCGKGFISSNILKVHLLTHSKQKPFQCNECEAAYTTKQQLQFHYKKCHNYTAEDMPEITRSLPYTMEAYAEKADETSLDSQATMTTMTIEETESASSQNLKQSGTRFTTRNY